MRSQMMRLVWALAVMLTICLSEVAAQASGTPAGTVIDSQAMVNYTQTGGPRSTVSNLLSLPVHEVLDFTVVWQDAAEVPVYAGDALAALTFRLENTGNGWETFQLTIISALSGDEFDPLAAAIYLDGDGDGNFDPLADDLYIEGNNDPELAADQPLTIFLVSDVPTDTDPGDRGTLKLAVGSEEGYGVPGTVVHGQGDGGTDAIIGPNGGFAEVSGTLQLTSVQVHLVKSALVVDATGRTLPAGSVTENCLITYTIDVTVTGSGTARAVIFGDPIPGGTTYVPGTLSLNNNPMTDAADSDAGSMIGNPSNPGSGQSEGTITIALGDLTTNSTNQQISFQVTLDPLQEAIN